MGQDWGQMGEGPESAPPPDPDGLRPGSSLIASEISYFPTACGNGGNKHQLRAGLSVGRELSLSIRDFQTVSYAGNQ